MAAAWCLDLDSLHLSGMSNGGMFSYYAMSRSQLCSRVNIDQGINISTLGPHVDMTIYTEYGYVIDFYILHVCNSLL